MDLKELPKLGQSVWLDYIRRDLLESGEFARLVREDAVSGVTTNPSIFEKAIAESNDYDSSIERAVKEQDATASSVYEQLVIDDVRAAAEVLHPTFVATEGSDGFISLEVSPHLARSTTETISEARRLWARVNRENVMIKVPATPEGLPAIEELIGEGININITLLFSRVVCRQVFDAYLGGLEALAKKGGNVGKVTSVASMFVSRIDKVADAEIEARLTNAKDADKKALRGLIGAVAIANAKIAYQDWKSVYESERWQALANLGAKPQRLLWASTSAKDPRFRDVMYVEALIGPETVDTLPPATLKAFREHGIAESRLEMDIDHARNTLETLARFGISIDAITNKLVDDGVDAFSKSFDKLFAALEEKRKKALSSRHTPHAATRHAV